MSMYGPPAGTPYGAPPPAKKGMSTGCIVAIVVVLLFFVSVGGVVLFIGYKISTNKDVQHAMGAIGDMGQIMAEAQTAPGTNELRALGCEQAMALDAAKMQKLGESFLDAGAASAPLEVGLIVTCQVGAFGTPPACDDAARAYVRGAAPSGKFMLSVTTSQRQTCSGTYSPSGALLSSGPVLTPMGRPKPRP